MEDYQTRLGLPKWKNWKQNTEPKNIKKPRNTLKINIWNAKKWRWVDGWCSFFIRWSQPLNFPDAKRPAACGCQLFLTRWMLLGSRHELWMWLSDFWSVLLIVSFNKHMDVFKNIKGIYHPWSWTWNLKFSPWKRRFWTWTPSFSGSMFFTWGSVQLMTRVHWSLLKEQGSQTKISFPHPRHGKAGKLRLAQAASHQTDCPSLRPLLSCFCCGKNPWRWKLMWIHIINACFNWTVPNLYMENPGCQANPWMKSYMRAGIWRLNWDYLGGKRYLKPPPSLLYSSCAWL